MFTGIARSTLSSHTTWSRGTLSILLLGLTMATGCRGCGTDKAAKDAVKAKKVRKKDKKPEGKSVAEMIASNGPRAELSKIEMRAPSAPEEARDVAPEVAAARDLILKGEPTTIAEGRTNLTEFLKTHETDADAHYWVGRSWMPERIVVPGVEAFTLAIQHDAEFIGARKWISVALHKENRCAEAMEHLDMVVQAKPEDLDALIDRAVCEMNLNQWNKALVDLSAYCEKKPDPFCPAVERVSATLTRATGERRRMTAEERKTWEEKQKTGKKNPTRQKFIDKMNSRASGEAGQAGKAGKAGKAEAAGNAEGAAPAEGADKAEATE
jgi:hypothetical protein